MNLISELRGFPSDPSKDIFGHDIKLDFTTMEIQWSNGDDAPGGDETRDVAGEEKDDFKRIADSIEALARTFARKDSQV